MNERDRLSEDLKRVQARIHNWLDRFFPEFTEVFKDWEGKAALVCLHKFPCPQDVQEKTASEIVDIWRTHGISRGVGISRANLLLEMADQSIGLTDGLQMARRELAILLSQYDLYQEQLGLLMTEVERLMSQVPGTQQMLTTMQSVIALCCRLIRVLFALGQRKVPYDPAQSAWTGTHSTITECS